MEELIIGRQDAMPQRRKPRPASFTPAKRKRFLAALAATCAFMLPVGTPPNAIVFGTGTVTIAQMARGGFVLNVVGILLITGLTYLLGGLALGLTF